VGWEMMLNMDVTGRMPPGPPVWEEMSGARVGEWLAMGSRNAVMSGGRCLGTGARVISVRGVCGSEPASLDRPLKSLSARFSSSSSRIRPSTRRTILPTANSLGCAAASRLPTLCTFCINLLGSETLVKDMTRRSRNAVATAHGLEPWI